jgi:hypothetical protein
MSAPEHGFASRVAVPKTAYILGAYTCRAPMRPHPVLPWFIGCPTHGNGHEHAGPAQQKEYCLGQCGPALGGMGARILYVVHQRQYYIMWHRWTIGKYTVVP